PQRHHEARGAEAALRAVAVDHRLLHRVQAVAALQVLDGEERLAVERRQEADARVHRLQPQLAGGVEVADDDRAGAAVALGAAFLRAGAAAVLAQPLEHRARRRRVGDLDPLVAVEEADGAGGHVARFLLSAYPKGTASRGRVDTMP